jgi:hypothetical protein
MGACGVSGSEDDKKIADIFRLLDSDLPGEQEAALGRLRAIQKRTGKPIIRDYLHRWEHLSELEREIAALKATARETQDVPPADKPVTSTANKLTFEVVHLAIEVTVTKIKGLHAAGRCALFCTGVVVVVAAGFGVGSVFLSIVSVAPAIPASASRTPSKPLIATIPSKPVIAAIPAVPPITFEALGLEVSPSPSGLEVVAVAKDGIAAAELQRGDIIVSVNWAQVSNGQAMLTAINDARRQGKRVILLFVTRSGAGYYATLRVAG